MPVPSGSTIDRKHVVVVAMHTGLTHEWVNGIELLINN